MRWFKHMAATRDDEKIVNLIASGGLEAYGFYWAIIEMVARQIEKDSTKCSVTYPLPYLSRQLYLHHNKVSNLLGKLQVTGLILLSKSEVDGGVNFTITCPNLLKYRDEYNRKSVKTPDKLRTNSGQCQEQEQIQKQIQIQNKDKKPNADKSAEYSPEFEIFWKAYPKKQGKRAAEKSFLKAIKKTDLQTLAKAIEVYKKSDTVLRGFVCHPSTWLNEERWLDESLEIQSIKDPKMPPGAVRKTASGWWVDKNGNPVIGTEY